jgi:hypothetical protein
LQDDDRENPVLVPLYREISNICKRFVLTSQKTRRTSTAKSIQLMTFRKTVAVYSASKLPPSSLTLKSGGRYHWNCPLKGSLRAQICIVTSLTGHL